MLTAHSTYKESAKPTKERKFEIQNGNPEIKETVQFLALGFSTFLLMGKVKKKEYITEETLKINLLSILVPHHHHCLHWTVISYTLLTTGFSCATKDDLG